MADGTSRPKSHGTGAGLGGSPVRDGVRLNGRLWLEKDGHTFIAWGRVVLLERIREHGSIVQAAKSMGMGYRHAWTLVDDMNRASPKPLVRRSAGGKQGGGTELTPEGEALVEGFWKLVDGFKQWIETQDPRLWTVPKKRGRGRAKGRKKA